jgi:hypothetical protein
MEINTYSVVQRFTIDSLASSFSNQISVGLASKGGAIPNEFL